MARKRWLLVPLALWLVACGFIVIESRSHLTKGHDAAADPELLSLKKVLDGSAAEPIRKAASEFGDASKLVSSPVLAPWRVVPVVGRQVSTVDDLSTAAARILRASATFVTTVSALDDTTTGAARIATVRTLRDQVASLRSAVDAADLGDGDGLAWFISDARNTLVSKIAELQASLDRASAALGGIDRLLEGPTDVLLLAANNAEMRAGHGALLSWGLLHSENGELSLPNGMQPIRTFPTPAVPPALDPSLAAGWGWLNLANVANLGVTPRFDVTADRLLDLYSVATGSSPSGGVLVVDSVALGRLAKVRGRGITDVDGKPIAPEDVLGYLLHTQYESIPADGLFDENTERRENLSTTAAQIVPDLLGSAGLRQLIDILDTLGRGRHILAYSTDPVLESAWSAIGIDGRLQPDDVSMALVNAGASKLDQFVRTAVTVATKPGDAGQVEVALTVTASNDTPPGEPPYIVGTPPADGPPGGYASLLTFSVPAVATGAQIDGAPAYAVFASDGATLEFAVRLDLTAGESKDVTARFTLPAGTALRFLPTARSPRTAWTVRGEPIDAEGPIAVTL